MTEFFDDRGAELREIFFESAYELLQSLNSEALKLEKNPGDAETIRTIRRVVHTLKGDAAACGFRELSELAHQFEDALSTEGSGLTALAEVAFSAADTFSSMLNSYQEGKPVAAASSLQEAIQSLAGQPKKKSARKKSAVAAHSATLWTEYELAAMRHAIDRKFNVFHVSAGIDPSCVMPIAARQLLVSALSGVAEVLATRPESGFAGNVQTMDLLIATDRTAEQIGAKAKIPTVFSRVDVVRLGTEKKPKRKSSTPKASAVEDAVLSTPESGRVSTNLEFAVAVPNVEPDVLDATAHETAEPVRPVNTSSENILRVDAERIDNVLNLVGELIIGKSMLQQALNEFARENPKDPLRGRFADAMSFQARVLNDLQRSVMKVRMVPVEQLFRRFPRMVRDVSKQCAKQVELVMTGQDTDLDKGLLDTIAEPLTHLVRNSISHGIEGTADRAALGKPEHGTIQLKAHHQGNQVVVEVIDDGKGIDVEAVRQRALQQGVIGIGEAARLTDAETLDLVFRPGFSTAKEITEISGRGVGLDVVRSVLQKLKGTVEIDTRPGLGTTFRMKLPLTLAIIKALLFRVEKKLYAISLNAVAEISRAREGDLHRVDGYEVLQLRNQVLPLVRLGRRVNEFDGSDQRERIFILVIAFGERKIGLIVNELEGEEELVIKSLDHQTVATDLVSGASILGDGRVVMIMNVAAILERFAKSRSTKGDGAGLLLSAVERQAQARFTPEATS